MIMLMGQMLFPFYFSQTIIDASESITAAVVESSWNEIENKEIKKMIVLILLETQQKRCLRAKGYADVSFENYTHVSSFV
jgi:hypothetical protein